MLKQTDKAELKKIKNYITKKEIKDNMYLFYNILKYYNIQDEIIFEERKTKYLKLINDFRERVFNHSLLTLAVLIGSSRFSLSADLFTLNCSVIISFSFST